ncbi:hypothetical protein BT96DRAFT_918538 [Gymnopus androsaceus JB14]|uniref:N-acetyltransferase domain-containing protein n=1 Tax=Gymnopus androsaceus JB14 TaxID=1447944 RepID=A0A6A4HU15_9AGAR|nr:hypothetical protein BT96DRAFT_918538 [Gymnopus androsaceus JB14]
MPAITSLTTSLVEESDLEINVYDLASDIPAEVWEALRQNVVRTNVVLPLAEKALSKELSGDFDQHHLWITCISLGSDGRRTVDFVLSCSKSEMGEYPIFIVATVPFPLLTDQFISPRLHNLILAMQNYIPLERVYSIFAPELIAELFADMWTESTGISHYKIPYYAAKLSYCTMRSFRNRQATDAVGGRTYTLRPAVSSDVDAVARLCLGFASESEPFVLDWMGALKEANMLISNEEVWVHETRNGSSGPEIACMVAYTRNTSTTATITKVMTSVNHRGFGCAQRLVRQVCKHLLHSGKQTVALYVAHDNRAATKVYHNVGFLGLDKSNNQLLEGVERWSEIGFDRTRVQLGHW